jgi:outer membrane protein assembly factor BamA
MVSTFGLSSSYDTRDDIFYPRKGIFATFTAETSGNFSFVDFEYSMFQLDVMGYYTLKQKHTIAANFYTGAIAGEAPFFSYFYLSSGKRGRGYNDRRFIDKNIGLAQVEYRFPIYKRFRAAAFTSLGTVSTNYSDLFSNRKIWSYGAGLRFQMSKKQMSHLRNTIRLISLFSCFPSFKFILAIEISCSKSQSICFKEFNNLLNVTST